MKKIIKFPLVLGVVALCAGALLSGTYNLTKETINNHKIEMQTGAIKNLYKDITSSDELDLNDEDKAKGITSAVKIVNDGSTYYVYQITFTDLVGGEETSFILGIDNEGKIDNIEFVSLGDDWAKKYNNDNFKESIIGRSLLGKDIIISGATNTGTPMFKAINQAFDNYRRVK